ncbi:MAG: potassium channel family protein [Patescibacteria group bacterium]|jgi:voltage-gated potassium channel Kch|nr:potassium channel family protein [Patescibacteria group bacterium]
MVKFDKEKDNLQAGIIAAGGAVITLLVIGTVFYHYLEKWSWISSLYFTVVTMATVGYGDLHPTTDISRLFTIFFILFGVTIAVASITFIGGQYLARREAKIKHRRDAREKLRHE